MLDSYLAKSIVTWYKYAALLHFIGGVVFLSNSAILPSSDSSKFKLGVKV